MSYFKVVRKARKNPRIPDFCKKLKGSCWGRLLNCQNYFGDCYIEKFGLDYSHERSSVAVQIYPIAGSEISKMEKRTKSLTNLQLNCNHPLCKLLIIQTECIITLSLPLERLMCKKFKKLEHLIGKENVLGCVEQ